jgi:hypothetical protein
MVGGPQEEKWRLKYDMQTSRSVVRTLDINDLGDIEQRLLNDYRTPIASRDFLH